MGQYYAVVNPDSKETLDQHMFMNGVKLTESCYVGNDFVDALSYLLEHDWFGDRVYLCGDYAFESMFAPEYSDISFVQMGSAAHYRNLLDITADPYELARGEYRDRSTDFSTCQRRDWNERPFEGSFSIDPGHYRYVVNQTEGVYYDREECPVSWVWVDDDGRFRFTRTDPLTIFLAVGNGLGGGDYCGPNEGLVGSWAGQTIAMSNVEPTRYRKISAPFDETKLFLTAPDDDLERAASIVAKLPLGGTRGYSSTPSLRSIKECIESGFAVSEQKDAIESSPITVAVEASRTAKAVSQDSQSDALGIANRL